MPGPLLELAKSSPERRKEVGLHPITLQRDVLSEAAFKDIFGEATGECLRAS
jgi:hypothetical protein